ncbi:MAG: glutamine synthetase III [Synergistaceae bacterium]|jgi:glutamine synthetase|nr:glutamine synthetase III [Synergistaceae bacterium]
MKTACNTVTDVVKREDGPQPRIREIFGSLVFDKRAMREHLPKKVLDSLEDAMAGRKQLDPGDADIVALAMKDWAIANGATHWAHWFHPLTEITAEKHMAFTIPYDDGAPLEVFRGSDLMQGEPDASSFPSAGRRSTFEARGYSAWDTSSSAFIVKSAKGGTLCIPSVFLSYDGTPLDLKTGLLRALDSIESQSMKLLRLFGQRGVHYVRMTVGAEQEYFLLDRPRAQQRPDIRFCGKTIIGAQPAKDQRLDHHYFGAIPSRVLSYMEDVERDLATYGITLATRHNEVARCQFEFAPLYAEANIACDQNQVIMETMRKRAREHELRLLFHEKPFDHMNGSGKHVNFSLMDSEGRNLLKPSTNQRKNIVFLTFLASFVYGASRHFTLLHAVNSTAGNMYRLGGHEAPPAIISVYLGEALTAMLKEIEHGATELKNKPSVDLGLAKLAHVKAFDSDRNRTSPVAFTGDKFEFRTPGSSQALALPVTAVASIWSWGIKKVSELMEKKVEAGRDPLDAALEVIVDVMKQAQSILFEGDAYTPEWRAEATKRGLIRSNTTPEAIDLLLEPSTIEMLGELGVYNKQELETIHEIRTESFATAIEVEMSLMHDMLFEGVLPAISKQINLEKESLSAVEGKDFPEGGKWKDFIKSLAHAKVELLKEAEVITELKSRLLEQSAGERAETIVKEVVPQMAKIRRLCDEVELKISAEIWPYPIYRNLLSLSM